MQAELMPFFLFLIFAILIVFYNISRRKNFFKNLTSYFTPYATKIDLTTGIFGPDGINVILKPELELESISLWLFHVRTGQRSSKTYVAIKGQSEPSTNYYLRLTPQGFGSFVKRLFGFTDVEIGDALIDRKFEIATNNPQLTHQIFQDPTFRKLILSLSKIRKFVVSGGRYLEVYVETNYNYNDAINAFGAMERLVKLVSPEAQANPLEYEAYSFDVSSKAEERAEVNPSSLIPPSLPPASRPSTVPQTPKVFPAVPPTQIEQGQYTQKDSLKRAFDDLQSVASKIEYIPSPDRFTQVIVTPWFSDVDQMKYELTNPMRVIGVENRYRPPNVPIEVSFEKVKELRDDYPTLGELRDAIKIRASEKDLEREFREKYTLLQLIARLTGLKQFRLTFKDRQIKVVVDCDLSPANIKTSFKAVKEAILAIKFMS